MTNNVNSHEYIIIKLARDAVWSRINNVIKKEIYHETMAVTSDATMEIILNATNIAILVALDSEVDKL
jgi:hypothetical protein